MVSTRLLGGILRSARILYLLADPRLIKHPWAPGTLARLPVKADLLSFPIFSKGGPAQGLVRVSEKHKCSHKSIPGRKQQHGMTCAVSAIDGCALACEVRHSPYISLKNTRGNRLESTAVP